MDQDYLTRLVRRRLVERAQGREPDDEVYVPPSLADLECRAAVTLRRDGRLVATKNADSGPVIEACQQAADGALASAGEEGPLTPEDLTRMSVEVELIGPRELIGDGTFAPAALAVRFEPAIHGIAMNSNGFELLVRPSQLISKSYLCRPVRLVRHNCNRYELTIQQLQERLGLRRDAPGEDAGSVKFLRFRTTHLYQAGPDAETIRLIAGMRPVDMSEVTRAHLTNVVDDLARYMRHRQLSDGLFAYEYLPGRDMYWPEKQSWVRQAGTTWAIALHARDRNHAASRKALDRALATFADMVQPLANVPHAAYLATPDGDHPLGATALLALALRDAPDPERYEALRTSLLNGIAAMQLPDGSFKTHFPPSPSDSSQDYYPGEALLAIARDYAQSREARWREVCDTAMPYYQKYFKDRPPPAFIPWQVQAWGEMARTTRLRKYADFVYEMSDALAEAQITRADPLPIYYGGFAVHGPGRAGIATAVYIEGFADAARTAETFGDHDRAKRYREIVRRGARFILQLRFREEEAYYVQSPKEVIGGMRNTPIHPALRIDHCQHALAALLGTIDLLPGEAISSPQEP